MSSRVPNNWQQYLESFPPRRDDFARRKYMHGTLPIWLADGLNAAILAAPVIPITNKMPKGTMGFPLNEKYLTGLNEQHKYRAFTVETVRALDRIFEFLRVQITEALCSKWRVLNCRSWTTEQGADIGPNVWHTDGDFKELMKLMIYSSPTSAEEGCLEIIPEVGADPVRIKGPAGRWVLFYNSVLKHRGVAPTRPGIVRVATEVIIAPSIGYDLRPKHLGQVGGYYENPYA